MRYLKRWLIEPGGRNTPAAGTFAPCRSPSLILSSANSFNPAPLPIPIILSTLLLTPRTGSLIMSARPALATGRSFAKVFRFVSDEAGISVFLVGRVGLTGALGV